MNTCMYNTSLLYYRIYRLKLKHHLLDLLPNFTSQNSGIIAKRFDSHAVVFISGWCKTEGEGKRCFVPATDEDNRMVVKTFGNYSRVLASEVRLQIKHVYP